MCAFKQSSQQADHDPDLGKQTREGPTHAFSTSVASKANLEREALILPGRTSHTRLFPAFHKFSYSYLMVGIPVTEEKCTERSRGFLSVDEPSRWRRGWLRVDAGDHLGRQAVPGGLRGKLDAYLATEGVDPRDFPYIYLITSPRLLGYQFSPASFWYLYNAQGELKAMIAEVNNTFDERRMYFLSPSDMATDDGLGSLNAPQDPERTFRHVWNKDFHVSPFSSRKGGYNLQAKDPMGFGGGLKGSADVSATLTSSKGHGKLVARLYSTSAPLRPGTMSSVDKTLFLLRWWWVGLVTYPRIVKEAIKLAQVRGLSIWFRPEPMATAVARNWTEAEKTIEHRFRSFIAHALDSGGVKHAVDYVLPDSCAYRIYRGRVKQMALPPDKGTSRLHVLTPAFFSRYVQYVDHGEAMQNEALPEAVHNRTASISGQEPQETLTCISGVGACCYNSASKRVTWFNALLWNLLRILRRAPALGLYPAVAIPSLRQKPQSQQKQERAHSYRFSVLDNYVRDSCTGRDQRDYIYAVLAVLLCERFAYGYPALLRLYGYIAQGVLIAVVHGVFIQLGWSHITAKAVAPGLVVTCIGLLR